MKARTILMTRPSERDGLLVIERVDTGAKMYIKEFDVACSWLAFFDYYMLDQVPRST